MKGSVLNFSNCYPASQSRGLSEPVILPFHKFAVRNDGSDSVRRSKRVAEGPIEKSLEKRDKDILVTRRIQRYMHFTVMIR